ncbi:Osteoclast-associated immunoglobulin-like receptor [Myotis davidii]|nr:Osteoclast-associated immunoglobulin-like receptor [Myotis davidii]
MGDKKEAQTPGVLKQEHTGAPNPPVPGRRGSWGQDSLRQERARRLDSWGQGSIKSRILRWEGRWKPGHLDAWEQRELRPRLLNPIQENLWAQMTVSCKRWRPRAYLLGTQEAQGPRPPMYSNARTSSPKDRHRHRHRGGLASFSLDSFPGTPPPRPSWPTRPLPPFLPRSYPEIRRSRPLPPGFPLPYPKLRQPTYSGPPTSPPKPSLVAQPAAVVTPGTNVTLTCRAPQPAWRFVLSKAGEVSPVQIHYPDRDESLMLARFLLKAVTEAQGGSYRCEYHNHQGLSHPSDALELMVTGSGSMDYTKGNVVRLVLAGLVLISLALRREKTSRRGREAVGRPASRLSPAEPRFPPSQ